MTNKSTSGLELMDLSDAELAALIRASSRDRCAQCTFGPGLVALTPLASNRLAHEFVAQMRSNAEATGEG